MSNILEATLLLLKDVSLTDLKTIQDEIKIEIDKRERKLNRDEIAKHEAILSDSESSSESEFSSDGEDIPIQIPKPILKPKYLPLPKRARTAYIFFTQDENVRQRLIEKFPNAGFAEISKLIADEWKKMTQKEKKPYIKMAEEDKILATLRRKLRDKGLEYFGTKEELIERLKKSETN